MGDLVVDATAKKELYNWINKYMRKNGNINDQNLDILNIINLLQYLGFSVVKILEQEDGAMKLQNKCQIEISCAVTGMGAILECKEKCNCSSLKNYEILDNTVNASRAPDMPVNGSLNSLQLMNGSLFMEQERKVPTIEELLGVPPNMPLTCEASFKTNDLMNTEQTEKLNKATCLLASKQNNALVLNKNQTPVMNGQASSDNIADSILGVIQTLKTVHSSLISTQKKNSSSVLKQPPLPTPRQGQSRIPVPVAGRMFTPRRTTARQELFRQPVSTIPKNNPYKRRSSLPLTSEVKEIMSSLSDNSATTPGSTPKQRAGSQSSLLTGTAKLATRKQKFERSFSSTKL